MACNGPLSELEGTTCKAHVSSQTSVAEDANAPLKLCCPSLTGSKSGVMVTRTGWNAKRIFYLLSVRKTASDPGSVSCSQICLDTYFIVRQLLKSQMRLPKHHNSPCSPSLQPPGFISECYMDTRGPLFHLPTPGFTSSAACAQTKEAVLDRSSRELVSLGEKMHFNLMDSTLQKTAWAVK